MGRTWWGLVALGCLAVAAAVTLPGLAASANRNPAASSATSNAAASSAVSPAASMPTSSPACIVSPALVNSCRAWLGAAAHGDPAAAADAVSQFEYLERLVGADLDVFRDYDNCSPGGCSNGTVPLASGSPERYYASHGTMVDVNWKPAPSWAEVGGDDPAVNREIAQAAQNIKQVAPHKVFVTVWHEPQNDVSPGTSTCPGLKGSAGSPVQYRAMWRNVEAIFHRAGVSNVVWDMNYMSYPGRGGGFDCLVPQLWPGNDLVDWVTYDTYSHGRTWQQTSGRFYQLLQRDTTPMVNFESKAWGIGEFGACNQPARGITATQYFASITQAVAANAYPRLKMYLVYADTGNHAGPGCLTDYDSNGQPDPAKQVAFNHLADTILRARR